ncbi:MAG: phosphoribosyltransferase [Crocinitomicaceae bacterium]|nr:phosphoribosyltransferase [Crocinitomicaceae bacterium]
MNQLFKNREHAGILLAATLKAYQNGENVVVLAIPRGGVVLGDIIAGYLNAPLEVVLVKKIGHPLVKEFAIGAVSKDKRILTFDEGVSQEYVESETRSVRAKIEAQYQLFYRDRKPISLEHKKVIIVDDGIASGNTLLLVIEVVKNSNPDKVIVAVPVAPEDIIGRLKSIVDEVICLEVPFPFHAVGSHYQHFDQVDSETVVQLLNAKY